MRIYKYILRLFGLDSALSMETTYIPSVLHRFAKYHVNPYKKRLFIACIFMCIVAGSTTATIKLASMVVDDVFIAKNATLAIVVPLLILVVFLIKGVAEYFQNYIIRSVGQHILYDMQMLLYKHLLASDIHMIQSISSGKLISGFTNDISTIRSVFAYFVVGVAKHLMTVLFLVIAMFNMSPKLATVAFIAFPCSIIPVQIIGRKINDTSYKTQSKLASYTAKLDEIFTSIKVVKSFQTEDREYNKAKHNCDEMLELYNKNAKLSAVIPGMMEIFNGITVALILFYQGIMVMNGESTPGTLLGFITGFISAYRPFKYVVGFGAVMQEGLGATKRIFEILDQKPQILEIPNVINPNIGSDAIIEYKNLQFGFGGKTILDTNLKVKSNNTIAIVGKSGSGKTTLMHLLMRFYDPSSGDILINGHSIKNMSIKHLRHHISYVSQEVMLFDATIADNIRYGNESATIEEIHEVARLSNADDFILRLDNGYNTVIGQYGYKLSGGQRQRISIARGLLKHAPIMIFDEATSALDYNAENEIWSQIKAIKKDHIIFIITHRITSIADADTIIVMDKGCIDSIGKHSDLIRSSPIYQELWNKKSTV